MNRGLALGLICVVGSACAGCALPLAALGTVAGLAASAVSTGTDVYSMGKLDSAELAPFLDVGDAVDSVGDELMLHRISDRAKDGRRIVEWMDDRKAKVTVTIEPRTPTLTHVRIDVGLFGSEPTARLILKRIRVQYGPAMDDPGDPGLPSLASHRLPRAVGVDAPQAIAAGSTSGERRSQW